MFNRSVHTTFPLTTPIPTLYANRSVALVMAHSVTVTNNTAVSPDSDLNKIAMLIPIIVFSAMVGLIALLSSQMSASHYTQKRGQYDESEKQCCWLIRCMNDCLVKKWGSTKLSECVAQCIRRLTQNIFYLTTIAIMSGYSEMLFETLVALQHLHLKFYQYGLIALLAATSQISTNLAESLHMCHTFNKDQKSISEAYFDIFCSKSDWFSLGISTTMAMMAVSLGDSILIGDEILHAADHFFHHSGKTQLTTIIAMLYIIAMVAVFLQILAGAGQLMMQRKDNSLFHEDKKFWLGQAISDKSLSKRVGYWIAMVSSNVLSLAMHAGYTLPLMHKIYDKLHESNWCPNSIIYPIAALQALCYLFDKNCLYGDDAKFALYHLPQVRGAVTSIMKAIFYSKNQTLGQSLYLGAALLSSLLMNGFAAFIGGWAAYYLSVSCFHDWHGAEGALTGPIRPLLQAVALTIAIIKGVAIFYTHELRMLAHLTKRNFAEVHNKLHDLINREIESIENNDGEKKKRANMVLQQQDSQARLAVSRLCRHIFTFLSVATPPVADAYWNYSGHRNIYNFPAYLISSAIAAVWLFVVYLEGGCKEPVVQAPPASRKWCHYTIKIAGVLSIGLGYWVQRGISHFMDASLSVVQKDHVAEVYSALLSGVMVVGCCIFLEHRYLSARLLSAVHAPTLQAHLNSADITIQPLGMSNLSKHSKDNYTRLTEQDVGDVKEEEESPSLKTNFFHNSAAGRAQSSAQQADHTTSL